MNVFAYDLALTSILTREQAQHEIERHGHDFSDFTSEIGFKESYTGREVLHWLGY